MFSTFTIVKSNFNPRSREGSDDVAWLLNNIAKISIHAPARGATMLIFPWTFYDYYFNPRSREGSDAASSNKEKRYQISIHAPARGATSFRCTTNVVSSYFNPRSREGSDKSAATLPSGTSQFQSTLPRGERHYAGRRSKRC